MVRCSHVRNMFASRACRKSVMIGDALCQQKMEKVNSTRSRMLINIEYYWLIDINEQYKYQC